MEMTLFDILDSYYKDYDLGENGVILTINIEPGHAKEVHYALLNTVPEELQTGITFEFVDESISIIATGPALLLQELVSFLDNLQQAVRDAESFKALAAESFTQYARDKHAGKTILLSEAWNNMSEYNVWACQRCGYVMLWARGRFPIHFPQMCPVCGSYMYQKQKA